jgi:two-component system, NarL family, sensor kinase
VAPSRLPGFVSLTGNSELHRPERKPPSLRRIIVALTLIALVLVAVVLVGATLAASRLADREAVNDAANTANLLATSVVTPALTDDLLTSQPAAVARMDQAVRRSVLPNGIVRVKLWRPDGTIVYSDDARLIGRTFALDDEQRAALASPQTRAHVSTLDRSENEFEQFEGKLVEVYRPVWTPSGRQLLFEVYGDYQPVLTRASDLRRALAGLLISTVLLLAALLAPLGWRLIAALRSAARQRERLLQRAVDASDEERRRIAVNLHDGPVQELVASSYATAGAAQRAETAGRADDAAAIREAEEAVRATVGSLRSVLVDLYPASLATAGLASALSDLAASLRSRGVRVQIDLEPAALEMLDAPDERLVYRTTRECLRNVASHAQASTVEVSLTAEADRVVLALDDDGVGFDAVTVLVTPPAGHLGLRSLVDLAERRGADLQVASAPGAGTRWRLVLPRTGEVAT